MLQKKIGVWFPAIRAGTGADVFTERLVTALQKRGVRAEISWLPHRAEYAPRSVSIPVVPSGIDIVHVNTWLPARFIPSELPVVATAHHCVFDSALSAYKSWMQHIYHQLWVRRLEAQVLHRAVTAIAVSRYTAKCYESVYQIPEPAIIPNGIDLSDVFKPLGRRFPNRPFRLIYVGSWSARKGVDLFPSIMKSLGAGFELLVTSDKAEGQLIDSGSENIVSIGKPDSANELASAYVNADALLFPSRLEGFGLAVLEAMACGLPVIATRCSALPEVIADGVTGFLCKQDDVSEFAGAVRRLAADHGLWLSMSEAARARVEALFTIELMVERYLDVYHRVLSDRAS